MPLQTIAIISTLKPVDDVRSHYKFAHSLSTNPDYNLHLFGYPSSGKLVSQSHKNIFFHEHIRFKRLGIRRFTVGLSVFFKLLKLKPQLIIVNTYELLLVTILNRILFGTKICYDIQENYYFNLKYQQAYPVMIRQLLAILVRSKEQILSPFFDHFLLAENCYIDELPFVKTNYTVLENKSLIPHGYCKQESDSQTIRLLFAGTISANTGVQQAVELFQFIKEQNQKITLKIIGHCPSKNLSAELESLSDGYIDINISKTPIPHELIVDAIAESDFGIVSYQTNKSNQHCMPTKVYEYAALGLPCIYQSDTHWGSFVETNKCGIGIDFDNLGGTNLYNRLTTFKASYHHKPIESAIWENEREQLIQSIHSLLNELKA